MANDLQSPKDIKPLDVDDVARSVWLPPSTSHAIAASEVRAARAAAEENLDKPKFQSL